MIRQLTEQDLTVIEELCKPFEFDGSVTLRKDLMLSLLNEVRYMRSQAGAGTLEIRSLVSMRDGLPYVTLVFGNTRVQLSFQETIDHARRLLEVAAGASADGFLIEFMKTEIEITDERKLSQMLQAFRGYRDRALGTRPDDLPLTDPDDE